MAQFISLIQTPHAATKTANLSVELQNKDTERRTFLTENWKAISSLFHQCIQMYHNMFESVSTKNEHPIGQKIFVDEEIAFKDRLLQVAIPNHLWQKQFFICSTEMHEFSVKYCISQKSNASIKWRCHVSATSACL